MQSIKAVKELFEQYLQQEQFSRSPQSLYRPFEYILSLGGKRIRPVSLLASAQLFGAEPKEALPAAFAIELFHNFTLIHDDIMDQASIRRGKPAVHQKFGENTAILSGDVMFCWAFEYLQQASPALPLIRLFNQTAIEVCEGQQYDMDFESQEQVSIEQYITMISLKTAVLLGCSMQMGAMIAQASEEDQINCYEFGKNLGISFQLQDDLLDAYGDQRFGKQIGGDIIQNKKTFLLLTAQQLASPSQQKELEYLMNDNTLDNEQKIQAVLSIFNELNVKEHTAQEAEKYYQKSIHALDNIRSVDTSVLRNFADQLVDREH